MRTYTFWPGPNAATKAEFERLLKRGCTVNEIALRMDRDAKQIESWLKRFGLRTRRAALRHERAEAREATLNSAVRIAAELWADRNAYLKNLSGV